MEMCTFVQCIIHNCHILTVIVEESVWIVSVSSPWISMFGGERVGLAGAASHQPYHNTKPLITGKPKDGFQFSL